MANGIESLSDEETRALTGAAAWYANYHARIIAEQLDDPSAAALAEREDYRNLVEALAKLGVKMRNPLTDIDRTDRVAA